MEYELIDRSQHKPEVRGAARIQRGIFIPDEDRTAAEEAETVPDQMDG